MKVEFLNNETLNNGHQILISESEFKKAKDNDDEFNSFAFATHCFFRFFDLDDYLDPDDYKKISESLEKNGAVIITVDSEPYSRRFHPVVYVSNNNRLKQIEL